MRKRIFIRITSALVAAAMLCFTAASLVGCSFLSRIFNTDTVQFTVSRLTLHIGERYDLSTVIESDSSSYVVRSSNNSVVSVDNRIITGVKPGTVNVTAETDGDLDRISVTVLEPEADGFEVTYDGSLIMDEDGITPVVFMPHGYGAVYASNVSWYVDSLFVRTLMYNEQFSYTPTRAGKFTVTARCGEFSAEYAVRVYSPAEVKVTHSGQLEQDGGGYPIKFKAEVQQIDGNPQPYFRLYDNGATVFEGEAYEHTVYPAPGEHNYTVEINGKSAYSATALCRGSVTPVMPSVTFDDMYPHFYIDYDVQGKCAVKITADGRETVYSQNDTRYASLFDGKRFDAGQMISAAAEGRTAATYKISVRSLGDGWLLTESEYSDEYVFTQLPNAAAEYIRTRVLDSDLYVTSASEYVMIAEYYILYRKKAANSSVSFDCYIAYELDSTASDLWDDAFPMAATSGVYSGINVTKNGNIMHTSFKVDTVNAPSAQTYDEGKKYTNQLHAILPHINYDADKYRSPSHVYPIDTREFTEAVYYSDELYFAAENGVRPIPQAGSPAETIYRTARGILDKICTDDMTDMQKAHAIYDWIMWQVTYDTPATYINKDGERYSAYYLEGVFGNGKTLIGGKAYMPYAVCDGMSKAYSLMCNIEGIPCVRVVGKAGGTLAEAGPHAWNKVYVNGGWYIVDCTWGDSVGAVALDGVRTAEYELGMHDHLFLTDDQASGTHFEPHEYNESAIVYAPRTAKTPINLYKTMGFGSGTVDCYISREQNLQNRLREIGRAIGKAYTKAGTVTVVGGVTEKYTPQYQGVELYIEPEVTVNQLNMTLASAIIRELPTATVRVAMMDRVAVVLIRT